MMLHGDESVMARGGSGPRIERDDVVGGSASGGENNENVNSRWRVSSTKPQY
jgi:hypothetical protein